MPWHNLEPTLKKPLDNPKANPGGAEAGSLEHMEKDTKDMWKKIGPYDVGNHTGPLGAPDSIHPSDVACLGDCFPGAAVL